ncbi:MAG: type II toxin-antitoxin system VapC family toxin [Candidatus Hydrogenedentes bacterium]|nr:type II toxin-antitoxin system VapC family toxin [Candidatus Hydrogenedentota bacterium]
MTLLDSNVIIYASNPRDDLHAWAKNLITDAALQKRAAANAITLAEVCAGAAYPLIVREQLLGWRVQIVDVPASAAEICAEAYRLYSKRRREALPENPAPKTPLPDFFIGAHASVMGWDIATADEGRFRTYFPEVTLHTPADAPE